MKWNPPLSDRPSPRLCADAVRFGRRIDRVAKKEGRPRPPAFLVHHDGRRGLRAEELHAAD